METITESIIQKIKQKDEEAFRIFFNEYKNKLFYICVKEIRDVHDAEDCVQEIFLKILKNIKDFDSSKACFNTWVIMLTKNCITDFMKQRNIMKEKCMLNSLLVYCRGVQNTYDTEILLSEIEQVVGEERYRILTLKRAFNFTFAEIGNQLSIHPSKAKSLYYEGYTIARDYVLEKEKKINGKH